MPKLACARVLALHAAILVAFGGASAALAAPPPRPKLVVLLAVDQMRADYVTLYGEHWKHGLRRLYDRGAHFRNARYPYLGTVTCPGHVTLGTGAYPYKHGMILNAWWDRQAGKVIPCTDDPAAPLVSYGEPRKGGDSARNIAVPTLGDEMKARLPGAGRVVSFSFKARSAIGLGGHAPDLVTWYSGGAWVTSRAFALSPHPVVARLLRANPIDRFLGKPWAKALPAAAYRHDDDAPDENPPSAWSRIFPHPLVRPIQAAGEKQEQPAPYALWERSPMTDEQLVRLAEGAIGALKLGRGPGTDLLAISFSALDVVGHAFGPRSHEVQDALARLDRILGTLMATLDRQVGAGRYVLALSSDHGVADIPEQLAREGKDAGRVPMNQLRTALSRAITAELGPGEHVANIQYTDVYLSTGVLARLRGKAGALGRVQQAVSRVPGIAAVFSADDLVAKDAADPLRRAAALSHFPGRSGDLVIVPRANWLTTASGTTHGTHHDYDQHVPILLFGAGIVRGGYDRPVSPADVAPTLAHILGIELPQANGRPLVEALRK